MPEYAPMLHVSYYAQNYAGIIRQGLPFCGGPETAYHKHFYAKHALYL